jgi:hypothetical protein
VASTEISTSDDYLPGEHCVKTDIMLPGCVYQRKSVLMCLADGPEDGPLGGGGIPLGGAASEFSA